MFHTFGLASGRSGSWIRIGVALCITCLSATWGCSSCRTSRPSAALAPSLQRSLSITKFQSSSLTDSDADHILSEASQIIANNACPLSLSRSGSVTDFNAGSGSVLTVADYQRVCAQPGYVHLVNSINWCNGITDALGCSDTPGTCIVMVRWAAPPDQDPAQIEEGILWAHEYGHTKNLHHRSNNDAVMNPILNANRLKIDQGECNAYLERSSTLPSAAPSQLQAATVEDFVHNVYIHGVPFEEARRFKSSEDVEKLGSLLKDSSQQRYWANAATTLGMIGTAQATHHLTEFIARGSGVLTPEAYRAKSSAVIAMGFALGTTGEGQALSFLINKSDPAKWQTFAWESPFTDGSANRDLQMARTAIAALGFSGNVHAESALEKLHSKPELASEPHFSESIDSAIADSQNVRRVGFDAYVIKNEELRGASVKGDANPQ
jgi:hypothetical protein